MLKFLHYWLGFQRTYVLDDKYLEYKMLICRMVSHLAILDDAPIGKKDVRATVQWHEQQQRRHLLSSVAGQDSLPHRDLTHEGTLANIHIMNVRDARFLVTRQQ